MISKSVKDQGYLSIKELLDKNSALETDLQALKIRLEEAEELKRAISEGDLDALIIPTPQGKLIFTLDSADRAYRVLVETMNEGTVTFAEDGTILYCNRRFAELVRMRPQAIVGASIYGFIKSEDEHTFKALQNQRTSAGEINLRAVGGISVPVYLSISSLQSEESQNAWCLVATDLTEQKKNEEIVSAGRLAKSIIEQAAEAIVVCDMEGKITHFSNTVSRICKCDPAFQKLEDIMDLRFSEGEDAEKSIFPVSSALKGDTIIGMEAILEAKDCQGFYRKLHFLLNSGPLKNSNDGIIGCVATLTDITERKRAETLRKAINSVNQVIHSTFDFDDIMKEAISEASRAIGCETAAISFREGRRWITRYVYGFPEDVIGAEMSDEEEPHAVLAIETRKPVAISDAFNDERVNIDHMKKWGVRSVLVIPLIVRSEVIGVLFLNYHRSTFTFDNSHLDFAVQLASSMSLALENSRLFKSLKLELAERKQAEKELLESEKRFKLLSEANSTLLLSKEPENMIKTIAGKVMHHLNCDVFFNYVFDETLGRLNLNACGGISEEIAKEIEWLDKGSSICGCVALDGSRIVSRDVQHNGDKRADLVRSMGIQAYSCQPLHIGEKTIGTLSFGARNRKDFREDELALMSTVADQVSVAIERKRAEDALRESEEKYRNIIETANEGIWILNSEASIVYANQKMAEMLGYDHEETIGRSAWDFTDVEGKEVAMKNMEKMKQGIDVDHELKLIRKNGSLLWTIVSAKPLFDKDGNFAGSMKMLTDITERKEAEVKLKQTLENLEKLVQERTEELEKSYTSLKESESSLAEAQKMAHLGNWTRNIMTGEIYWSDEVYRIFGFKPQEFEVTFDVLLSYVHPEDRGVVENNFKKALNGELYSTDYRVITANGTERIIHSQGEVIFDERNIPIEIRGTVQDITERKKAEEALEKIDKVRIKEIHHRIKNNLQVICSLLSLEAERFSDEKMLETLKESQNRVASMALIHEELYKGDKNDTLDFAAYLRKLTADLFSSYILGNDNISLKMDLEQVYLDMDTAIPLGIIINELISNSLKHAFPAGSEGEINISLHRTETFVLKYDTSPDQACIEKGDFQYILRVSDNGRGIPEEIEIEDTDSLGLQLVNILVDQIDGCIELNRDYGTDFTIWFGNKEL